MPPTLAEPMTFAPVNASRTLVFREVLSMGMDSIRSDKIRAAMTALGMAVGTAALILVVTVALTGKHYVLAQIEGVGINVIWAEYNGVSSAGTNPGMADYLTIQDMDAVERRCRESKTPARSSIRTSTWWSARAARRRTFWSSRSIRNIRPYAAWW